MTIFTIVIEESLDEHEAESLLSDLEEAVARHDCSLDNSDVELI